MQLLFFWQEHFVDLGGVDQAPQQEVDHGRGRPEVAGPGGDEWPVDEPFALRLRTQAL